MTRGPASPRRKGRPRIAASESHTSAFDRVIAWIDGLPLPAWLFYVLATAATFAAAAGLLRVGGSPVRGQLADIFLLFNLLTAYPLAMMHYLKRAARGSLKAFRPALGKLEAEYPHLEASLTRISGPDLWIAVALGAIFTVLSVANDPQSWGLGGQLPLVTVTFALIQGTWVNIGFMALLRFLIRQIRCIARIHLDSTNISLYERSSHHAFSRLTLVAAVGLLIPVYAVALLLGGTGTGSSSGMSEVDSLMMLVLMLLSAVVFIVPLYGMRRRLEQLKKAALQECDRRFQSAASLLHARLDAGSLKGLEGLNHAVASLTLEREALQRISTWPWAADTLRRYISSVALPVFVFLLGRYIGRFLGL